MIDAKKAYKRLYVALTGHDPWERQRIIGEIENLLADHQQGIRRHLVELAEAVAAAETRERWSSIGWASQPTWRNRMFARIPTRLLQNTSVAIPLYGTVSIERICKAATPTLRRSLDMMRPYEICHIIDADEYGVLVCFRFASNVYGRSDVTRRVPRSIVAVLVVDPSQPKEYAIGVPNDCRSAQEAVAWTFGISTSELEKVSQHT